MMQALEWLMADYKTLFRLDAAGRIEGENDPDGSPGPRFWLAGCAQGNICGTRADVSDATSTALVELTASEPPFVPDIPPRELSRYIALLEEHAPVSQSTFGLIYELPHALRYDSTARLLSSESDEGRTFLKSLTTDGIPEGLHELGFRVPRDFWTPWCLAVVGGEVASLAFAARLSPIGAELGLATVKAYRGHGFGAAATAGWTNLPLLESRTLFYSTDWENLSSQRVTRRLGLHLRGASLRLT